MAIDSRQRIIWLKLFINIVAPLYLVVKQEKIIAIPTLVYALLFLVEVLIVVYVEYRKSRYQHLFLRKIYVPSNKLFVTTFFIEIPVVGLLYAFLDRYLFGILHLIPILILYILIYIKRSGKYTRKSSFKERIKFGVIARNIGNEDENGLKKGELVKIMRKTNGGYVVKNRIGEFSVSLEDIGEIININ